MSKRRKRRQRHSVQMNTATGLLVMVLLCGCARVGEPDAPRGAIDSIRQLHAAEVQYYSLFGRYGDLRELGPSGANLISAELANGIVEGYRISLQRTEAGYGITARSLNRDYPSFYSDQTLKTQTINRARSVKCSGREISQEVGLRALYQISRGHSSDSYECFRTLCW